MDIVSWLKANQHPPFGHIFNWCGIIYSSDCGLVPFALITNIFDYLAYFKVHQSMREKVRFERDITSLHIQYRKYCKLHKKSPTKSVIATSSNQESKPSKPKANNNVVKMKIMDTEDTTKELKKSTIRLVEDKENLANGMSTICMSYMCQSNPNTHKNLNQKALKKTNMKRENLTSIRRKQQQQSIKYFNLWVYKCVILDYLNLKNLKMPEKSTYDSLYTNYDDVYDDFAKYKAEIKVELSPKAKRTQFYGFDNDALIAEYKAFADLYQYAVTEAYIDQVALKRIVQKYEYIMNHYEWNKWWFNWDRRDYQPRRYPPKLSIFEYFYDINTIFDYSEKQKAEYFYNINIDFDQEFDLNRDEQQMLWFHAVSYLFKIKKFCHFTVNKDLLMMIMSNFYSRREFFDNVGKFGFIQTMRIMQM